VEMIDLDAAGGAGIAVGKAWFALQRQDARDECGMEVARIGEGRDPDGAMTERAHLLPRGPHRIFARSDHDAVVVQAVDSLSPNLHRATFAPSAGGACL